MHSEMSRRPRRGNSMGKAADVQFRVNEDMFALQIYTRSFCKGTVFKLAGAPSS